MFLCRFTSLETLHLRFEYVLQPDNWVQAETLVRSLPRPTQLVNLYISASSYAHGPLELLKFEGLEALDETLQLELFQGLQAVKLHVEYSQAQGDPEEGPALTATMLAVMKSKSPQLVARNIIEVSAEVYYMHHADRTPTASTREVGLARPLAHAHTRTKTVGFAEPS